MVKQDLLSIAKPINCSSTSVRAILDGRKTVIRKHIKFPEGTTGHMPLPNLVACAWYPNGCEYPRYQKGDYLYVREKWNKTVSSDNSTRKYIYKASDKVRKYEWLPANWMPKDAARLFLRVTDVRVEYLQDITEEQAIKEGHKKVDCEYSGIYDDEGMNKHPHCIDCWEVGCEPPIVKFQYTWDDKIRNLKHSSYDLYCWDANPLVWVYEFEKVEVEE